MKKLFLFSVVMSLIVMFACAPVNIQKCYTDYKYGNDGKVQSEYKECITQVPERMPPIHLKHQDLYQ